jgi:hypothetical protein
MNKIIVLLAVLALTGCGAASSNEGAYLLGGAGRAPSGGDDGASQPARVSTYEAAPREVASRHVQTHHEADFVVCAQCRR